MNGQISVDIQHLDEKQAAKQGGQSESDDQWSGS